MVQLVHQPVIEPSHVLKAMGLSDDDAFASLRFSMGKYNTIDDIETVVNKIKELTQPKLNMLKDCDWSIDRDYKTGSENEPLQFYLEGLANSNEFNLLLGYFSSAAINLLSVGFCYLYKQRWENENGYKSFTFL